MPICLDRLQPLMQIQKFLPTVVMCLIAALCCPGSLLGLVGDKPAKFFVRFIATSTVIRSDSSGNQDVYLVELNKKPNETPFLAKLVDEYPSYGSAIPRRLLISKERSLAKVKRDPECDVRYADMLKRAAPGDPMAIYPSPMTYIPGSELNVSPDLVVQCFRLVRR
jgi:hypothetical protein